MGGFVCLPHVAISTLDYREMLRFTNFSSVLELELLTGYAIIGYIYSLQAYSLIANLSQYTLSIEEHILANVQNWLCSPGGALDITN